MQQIPQLLVSVRNAEEACRAVSGGAEIIDVKEPVRGPLGMADVSVIAAIADTVAQQDASRRCSAALGEVSDWLETERVPALPDGLQYAKLGLSGLARSVSWRREWQDVRRRFEQASSGLWKWIAVAYADRDAADCPRLDEIIVAAAETSCAGVLIDTFDKRNGNLLSHLSADELSAAAEQCHASGLFLAVAGRLAVASLSHLAGTGCDVVGIRSAACDGRDRQAAVRSESVAEFRRQMAGVFTHAAENRGDRRRQPGAARNAGD
ncbi:MAG: (5-formylfuran-3-yl)methyl phosphate synthase [Maioricimonas sp. JB049]